MRQRLRYSRAFLLICIGSLIALGSLLLYGCVNSPTEQLTEDDVAAIIEETIASAAPEPFYATQVFEVIRPSVVRINTFIKETEGETQGALGTGVVISDTGIILTSLHILEEAIDIHVVFADGTESRATVIDKWPDIDLAALSAKLIPDDLVPATLAGSSTLRVGDQVVAVGNPFGITNSLSAGVVSGLGRRIVSNKTDLLLENLIQFDAAVNSGNSGGPLVNRDGEVVGIVSGLLNPTDEELFIGIGFAVPIETVMNAMGPPPY